jgi:hypothetical protein
MLALLQTVLANQKEVDNGKLYKIKWVNQAK